MLAVENRVLGEAVLSLHPGTLTTASNLALTYIMQGRLAEAAKLQKTVLAATYIHSGRMHPKTLTAAN